MYQDSLGNSIIYSLPSVLEDLLAALRKASIPMHDNLDVTHCPVAVFKERLVQHMFSCEGAYHWLKFEASM